MYCEVKLRIDELQPYKIQAHRERIKSMGEKQTKTTTTRFHSTAKSQPALKKEKQADGKRWSNNDTHTEKKTKTKQKKLNEQINKQPVWFFIR